MTLAKDIQDLKELIETAKAELVALEAQRMELLPARNEVMAHYGKLMTKIKEYRSNLQNWDLELETKIDELAEGPTLPLRARFEKLVADDYDGALAILDAIPAASFNEAIANGKADLLITLLNERDNVITLHSGTIMECPNPFFSADCSTSSFSAEFLAELRVKAAALVPGPSALVIPRGVTKAKTLKILYDALRRWLTKEFPELKFSVRQHAAKNACYVSKIL